MISAEGKSSTSTATFSIFFRKLRGKPSIASATSFWNRSRDKVIMIGPIFLS